MIGSLIEKQLTTPQQHPLSLNALLSACNQSSNRDPVVSFGDRLVEQALARLKDAGLVHFVHPSHGRSTTRYAQALDEQLSLDRRRLAVIAALVLRGPQTAGELRARTERMAAFAGIGDIESELRAMAGGPEPLVSRLPRRPGQKEERWAQLLSVGGPDGASGADLGAGADSETGPPAPAGSLAALQVAAAGGPGGSSNSSADQGGPAAPAGEVAALRADVTALGAALESLQAGRTA